MMPFAYEAIKLLVYRHVLTVGDESSDLAAHFAYGLANLFPLIGHYGKPCWSVDIGEIYFPF